MEHEKRLSSKDFRIGNIIEHNGEIKAISSLHEDDTFRTKKGDLFEGCFRICTAEPVKITVEWLVKFGFKLTEGGYVKRFSRFGDDEKSFLATEYNPVMKRWLFVVGSDNSETVVAINAFEFLHQLQNLYFSLTGEELILK